MTPQSGMTPAVITSVPLPPLDRAAPVLDLAGIAPEVVAAALEQAAVSTGDRRFRAAAGVLRGSAAIGRPARNDTGALEEIRWLVENR